MEYSIRNIDDPEPRIPGRTREADPRVAGAGYRNMILDGNLYVKVKETHSHTTTVNL